LNRLKVKNKQKHKQTNQQTNKHTHTYTHTHTHIYTQTGCGIYRGLNSLRHSCQPNAEIRFDCFDNTLRLVALKDLEKASEIRVSYFLNPEQLSNDERKLILFVQYGIDFCDCILCSKSNK